MLNPRRRITSPAWEAIWKTISNWIPFELRWRTAAGQYVEQCEKYLEGQQKDLAKDMLEGNRKITLVNNVIALGNDTRVKVFKSQALKSPVIMEDALGNFPKIGERFGELRKITQLDMDLKRIRAG